MTFRFADSVTGAEVGGLLGGSEKWAARTPDSLRVLKDVEAVKFIVSKQEVTAKMS